MRFPGRWSVGPGLRTAILADLSTENRVKLRIANEGPALVRYSTGLGLKVLHAHNSVDLVGYYFEVTTNPNDEEASGWYDIIADVSIIEVDLFTHPGDPAFMRIAMRDRDAIVEVLGEKDQQGLPTYLRLFRVKDRDNTTFGTVRLDYQGRPVEIFVPDTAVYQLSWESDKAGTVTVVLPDGSQQSVAFEL